VNESTERVFHVAIVFIPSKMGNQPVFPAKFGNLAVLYTPTAFPTDSDGLLSDPAISNGSGGQSVGVPSESIGIHRK